MAKPKGKVRKGKLSKVKPKAKGKLVNLTAKKQYIVYRDKETGRLVSAKNLDGTRKVKYEIWRVSKTAEKKRKRLFVEDHYTLRKKAITKKKLMLIARKYYKRHKHIKVFMENGNVMALTGSP